MEYEKIINETSQITLNITANEIDSYRELTETENTVRVYDNGKIGIAGCIGKADFESLMQEAQKKLSHGIEYPEKLSGKLKKEIIDKSPIIEKSELLSKMRKLLERITDECPNFAVTNKIQYTISTSKYENSKDRELISSQNSLSFVPIFQDKNSSNLFDCFFGAELKNNDIEDAVSDCKLLHDSFYKTADIEDGVYPVVINTNDLFELIARHFDAEAYMSGGSVFSGKLKQKAFNDSLTLTIDRNPETNNGTVPFFDAEGEISDDLRPTIIKNGVFEAVATNKKTAEKYGIDLLKCAGAAYDEIPTSYGGGAFRSEPTHDSVESIVPGKCIFAMILSGGDMTPNGNLASPVQLAYLVENGKITARLPQINISGSVYDILGNNYLGSVEKPFFKTSGFGTAVITKMNVTK